MLQQHMPENVPARVMLAIAQLRVAAAAAPDFRETQGLLAPKTQRRDTLPELGVFSLAKQNPSQSMITLCRKQGAKGTSSGSGEDGCNPATNKLETVRLSEQRGPGTGFPQE